MAVQLESSNVERLVAGVGQLSADELDAFSKWFEEYLADVWDQQIEADVLAGRLEAVGQKAEEDFNAGKCSPLSVTTVVVPLES